MATTERNEDMDSNDEECYHAIAVAAITPEAICSCSIFPPTARLNEGVWVPPDYYEIILALSNYDFGAWFSG